MIINSGTRDVKTTGVEDTVKMSISLSEENQSHIIKVLTENYKWPLDSLIRENVSNHWDSHIAAGKKEEVIPVKLYRTNLGYILETSDTGLGLSEEEFYKYYMALGESTKRNSNEFIGGMGCGAKAALSYTDSYEVICVKDGLENGFLVFKGSDRPECMKLYSRDTDRENGVIVKVPIYNYYNAVKAIQRQLCYFPTVHIQIENDSKNYLESKIFGNELFQWSEVYPDNEMHISFSHCRYEIDWKVLNISPIKVPIAIKIELNEGVSPFFNRESLTYTQSTKDLIMSKIKSVAEWFCNKYNENWKEYNNIVDAWNQIDNRYKIVRVAGESFQINDLIQYSDIKPKELSIKGLSVKNPKYYYDLRTKFLDEYVTLAKVEYYKWRTKHISHSLSAQKIADRIKVIEVESAPTGRVKKFLLQKYTDEDILFVKKMKDRKLGSVHEGKWGNTINYRFLLNLSLEKKTIWRALISEFQFVENQFKERIIDETQVENSQEYQNWLKEYKEYMKLNRANNPKSGNYKSLNKGLGDITIQIARETKRGENPCTFEKKVFAIKDLHKNPYLTVYFPEEQKEKAIQYFQAIGEKVTIAIIGRREITKLPNNLKNHMNQKQFELSRKFRKSVTSQKIAFLIEEYNELYNRKSRFIVSTLLDKFSADTRILNSYWDKNQARCNEEMMAIAEEFQLWDLEIMPVYNRVKDAIKTYSFLNLFNEPENPDQEKEMKSLINKILYIEKLKGGFNELEITVAPKKEIEEIFTV